MPVGKYPRNVKTIFGAFLKRIERTDSCWMWKGAKEKTGYGRLCRSRSKTWLAHRLSWLIYRGPIPIDKMVLHKCAVKLCINPQHLYLGGHRENALDLMKTKNYFPPPRMYGERHPNSKLNWVLVKIIRKKHSFGVSYSKILKYLSEYHRVEIDKSTVASIVKRQTWQRKIN